MSCGELQRVEGSASHRAKTKILGVYRGGHCVQVVCVQLDGIASCYHPTERQKSVRDDKR